MFTKEEWKLIYVSLASELEQCKKFFEEFQTLELANKIKELNELIKKVEEKL